MMMMMMKSTDSSYRESLCASTRAGMTHATSVQQVFNLNTNAVTTSLVCSPLYRVSSEQESVVSKNQEKKEKI
jgi:hypothetical protein